MRFVIYLITSVAAGVAAVPSLTVTLSAPPTVQGVDNFELETTLDNTGSETAKLLKDPNTILSNAPSDKFVLRGTAGAPRFIGMMINYHPEMVLASNERTGLVVLEPGKSLKVKHKLANAYNFTQSGEGEYNIAINHDLRYVDASGKSAKASVNAGSVKVTLRGQLSSAKSRLSTRNLFPRRITVKGLMRLDGFDKDQESQIIAAAETAEKMIADSTRYLDQVINATNTIAYQTYFGEFTHKRYELVKTVFRNITRAPTLNTYYNTCTQDDPGVTAYVFPDREHEVFICPRFFKPGFRNPLSFDKFTQAGVIIHECTHFQKNTFSTLDFAYGSRNVENLAEDDPDTAIRNADNYEYFADSKPLEGWDPQKECGFWCKLFS